MRFHHLIVVFLLLFQPLFCATVLITGANRGLGLEFAKQFKAKGYEVIGTARDPEDAKELKELGVRIVQLDVTDKKSVNRLKADLSMTPIDLLINNAGIMRGRYSPLLEVTFNDMEDSFAVNATGPLMVTQALYPNLIRGEQKRVVNITSQLGSIENNSGGMYAYRASKAALNQITKTLSIELRRQGFTVVAMHPGWVQTDMGGENATYNPEESIRSMITQIEALTPRSNGNFFDLNGNTIPW